MSLADKKKQAETLANNNQFSEAKALYQQLCRDSNAQDAEVWYQLAGVHGALNEFDQAEDCCRRAISLNPRYADAFYRLGNSLSAREQHLNAEEYYNKAIQLRPDFVNAYNNLGLALVAQYKYREAIAIYDRAIKLAPSDPVLYINEGFCLLGVGDLEKAQTMYTTALSLNDRHIEALLSCAVVLYQKGKYEDALEPLTKAISLYPDDLRLYYKIADCHAAQDRLEQAEQILEQARAHGASKSEYLYHMGDIRPFDEGVYFFKQAIEADPVFSLAYLRLSSCYRQLGQIRAALEVQKEGLEQEPDNPLFLEEMGDVFFYLSELEQAENYYRKTLKWNPGRTHSIIQLAEIEIARGNFDRAYELIKPLVDNNNIEALLLMAKSFHRKPELKQAGDAHIIETLEEALKQERRTARHLESNIHFVLGSIYDRKQQYDTAFQHYRLGNETKKAQFDSPGYIANVDKIIASYNPQFFASAPQSQNYSVLPVFIVGMPRSGTTLIEQILSSHPDFVGAGELFYIMDFVKEIPVRLNTGDDYPLCLAHFTQTLCDELSGRYLEKLELLSNGARFVINKTPLNFYHLGLIQMLFPKARIIHSLRHPIDTCLSCYFQSFLHPHNYSYDLNHLVGFYHQYQRLMDHWQSLLNLPIHEIHYEQIIESPKEKIMALLDFFHVPWDDRCLEFHKNKRTVFTSSYEQVRQPIYKTSKGRWRHYEKHIGPFIDAFAKTEIKHE